MTALSRHGAGREMARSATEARVYLRTGLSRQSQAEAEAQRRRVARSNVICNRRPDAPTAGILPRRLVGRVPSPGAAICTSSIGANISHCKSNKKTQKNTKKQKVTYFLNTVKNHPMRLISQCLPRIKHSQTWSKLIKKNWMKTFMNTRAPSEPTKLDIQDVYQQFLASKSCGRR